MADRIVCPVARRRRDRGLPGRATRRPLLRRARQVRWLSRRARQIRWLSRPAKQRSIRFGRRRGKFGVGLARATRAGCCLRRGRVRHWRWRRRRRGVARRGPQHNAHRFGVCRPQIRLQRQRLLEQPADGFGHRGIDLMRRPQRVGSPARVGQQAHRRLHRQHVGRQTVQRGAKGVQIAACVGAGAFDLLRWRVALGVGQQAALGGGRRTFASEALGQAEVQQHDRAVGFKLDILRLDVAMHDRRLQRVQIVQHVEHLVAPGQHLLERVRRAALGQLLGQIATTHKLHHQILPVGSREMVDHRGQRRVLKVGQQAGFALELAADAVADAQQPLERNTPAEALVDSLIYRAEAALTDQVVDAIALLHDAAGRKHVHARYLVLRKRDITGTPGRREHLRALYRCSGAVCRSHPRAPGTRLRCRLWRSAHRLCRYMPRDAAVCLR